MIEIGEFAIHNEIGIHVGIEIECGEDAILVLHDHGLLMPQLTAGDCVSLEAVLRDAADALEKFRKSIQN